MDVLHISLSVNDEYAVHVHALAKLYHHIYCNTNALWSLTHFVPFIECASKVYGKENVYQGSIYTQHMSSK